MGEMQNSDTPGMRWPHRLSPFYVGKSELFNTGITKVYFVCIWIPSASERNINDYAPGNCSSVISECKITLVNLHFVNW